MMLRIEEFAEFETHRIQETKRSKSLCCCKTLPGSGDKHSLKCCNREEKENPQKPNRKNRYTSTRFFAANDDRNNLTRKGCDDACMNNENCPLCQESI